MNYLGVSGISKLFINLKGFYSGINGATLTGAIDAIVVEQEDGTYKCSPFHVRFGKLGVLRSREKVVEIEVNGETVPIRMKLGESGEAFFVEEVNNEYDFTDENLATSPLPMSPRNADTISTRSLSNMKIITRRDTDESVDVELLNSLIGDRANSDVKADDTKKRRRKKRKKNQGSKQDIGITSQNDSRTSAAIDDTMFAMDEDLLKVSEELSKLDTSANYGTNLPHTRSFHRDFYSDTEVDGTSTPHKSRPATPIQSDSEYEITKHIKEGDDDDEVGKWAWGELPSPAGAQSNQQVPSIAQQQHNSQLSVSPQVSSKKSSSGSDENPVSSDDESRTRLGSQNRSMLSGMFSFMKRNQRQSSSGSNVTTEHGMYLDDINPDRMDPDEFALYFPNVVRERDSSFREGDEDVESGKGSSLPQSPFPGSSPRSSQYSSFMDDPQRMATGQMHNLEAISLCGNNLALFEQSQLTFDDLVENPDIVFKSADSIVVKMDGRYVSWAAALPTLLSTAFFQRPLPDKVYQKLLDQYGKKDEPLSGATADVANNKKQGSWFFSWRRSNSTNSTIQRDANLSPTREPSEVKSTNTNTVKEITSVPIKTTQPTTEATSSSDESETADNVTEMKSGKETVINLTGQSQGGTGEKFKKTLRLSSEQIKLLGLKYGQNEAVFSVTTAFQGTTLARCHIYLWKYDDRIVISDIDGTITKSDVLGHVLPMIGNDWSQSGVAQLFTQIQGNGYKMLYLSARSIGQAASTRDYLKSIKQDDITLPDGPLLLNPTSLMSAFHREVIERKPEEFKVACLKDVQMLFPSNPFYAGYGNRINDVWAYRAVDIAVPRIFTINHRGELRHALTNTFQSSYTNLIELVEHIFPVYKDKTQGETDGYNTFEFWREPIPDLPIPPQLLPSKETATTSTRRSN